MNAKKTHSPTRSVACRQCTETLALGKIAVGVCVVAATLELNTQRRLAEHCAVRVDGGKKKHAPTADDKQIVGGVERAQLVALDSLRGGVTIALSDSAQSRHTGSRDVVHRRANCDMSSGMRPIISAGVSLNSDLN